MKVLLLGATGATGRLLAEMLLQREHHVIAIARSPEKLPEAVRQHTNCTVIANTVLDMDEDDLVSMVTDCDAAVSCLGHNISFRGMYGKPRMLVTDSVKKICNAMRSVATNKKYKLVLMNSAGVKNKDAVEKVSFGENALLRLIRLIVPPHVDNEQAAEVLRNEIGQHVRHIEWVVVRPDTLIDEGTVSDYEAFSSPTRSAIFRPGKTSRVNVAYFIAELLTNHDTWGRWKGTMPVVYNRE